MPWSILTWMPLPPAQPVRTTVPAAAAPTGVPHGTPQSRPVWSFHTLSTGWKRMPNLEVVRPFTGRVSSASGLALPIGLTFSLVIVFGAVGRGTGTSLWPATSGVAALSGSYSVT